jgi:hypothetical protein
MMRSLKRAVVGADAQARPNSLQSTSGVNCSSMRASSASYWSSVYSDGEFLLVGVIAGIDAHHLDPFGGFHGGVGLEMDVGHDGHRQPRARSSATMFSGWPRP